MIETTAGIYVANPMSLALHPRPVRATAVTPDLAEAAAQVWTNDEGARVGFWDCQPGEFTLHCAGYTEICQILTGTITVEEEGGAPITLTAGDALIMPSGWRGTWRVAEYVKKLFVIVDDSTP
jgi:uncharacterized cupin superfamily protein